MRTPELARRTLPGGALTPLNGEFVPELPEWDDDDELPFIWTSPPSFPSPTYNDLCVVLPVLAFAGAGPALLVLPPRGGKKGVADGTKASDVHSTTRENAMNETK